MRKIEHISEKILKAYTFPGFEDETNKDLAERLKTSNAASCHIRRGDYLKEPAMCVCTPSYYARAIKTMNESVNPELYVIFSDDIQWCKENIREMVGNREVVFVDWNKGEQSFRDIQLMTLCKHNIIANSSFSWWGAWLNNHENKVVMAPEVWMNKPLVNDPIVILMIDALRKLNQDKITIVFVGNGPEEEMLRQKAAGNNNIFFAISFQFFHDYVG